MNINKLLLETGYHISYSSKESFNFGLVIVIVTFEKILVIVLVIVN